MQAQNFWPAESWNSATNLTSLSEELEKDLSGAHWNPLTRELFVVNNGSGTIIRLVEDGVAGLTVRETWQPGGDLEGITQADYNDNTVFVIDEKSGKIEEYEIGEEKTLNKWNISIDLPDYLGGLGPEGIAFVPDKWLKKSGFENEDNKAYTSKNGMGGLMFVAHQFDGHVYVFDLDRLNNSYDFVGEYKTSKNECAGLEFDRSTGELYILHNKGKNYIEVAQLSSKSSFKTISEFYGPNSGNIEGIALTPSTANEQWCWITLDDSDKDALRWFEHFDPKAKVVYNPSSKCLSLANFANVNNF